VKSDADAISEECDALKVMLIEKSKAYGSSWRDPLRVFSRADPVEQLRVRIDDKLSRLMRGSAAGEDVVLDLLGYLVLLRIATRKIKLDMPEGWNDPRQEPRDSDGREPEMTDDMQDDMQDGSRVIGYVPRENGAGFDGPYTQVIETALALETVVSDAGNALIGRVSVGVLDILSHHAAKLRAYAAREFARLEPKTTG